ncbi:MAG: translation initiation factor [Acaryochloridaceae cyanobacterium SU_2_1]|nr:translation initiation factor [Acaryochloridaceae cyanobacterium SU_2_1]
MTQPKPPSSDRRVYNEFGSPSSFQSTDQSTDRPDLPPAQQSLKIQVSRKGRKGKTVTVVSGFQTKPATLTDLTKTLKAQCGTGGTLKEGTIEIQGDHRQKLAEVLQKLGYRVKFLGG